MQHLGEYLRLYRQQAGLSQATLARRVGITENGLQKIEYGERMPRPETLQRLCDELGIEVHIETKVAVNRK